MLRLVHSQTVQGAILVDDIDDGLPNKTAHRLGSVADPDAYARDGYANDPKQSVYIPRVKPTDTTLPGYIDLEETDRVIHSAGSGKISGLSSAGLISVVSFVEGDVVAPVITAATLDTPASGDVTIDGTGFLSTSPEVTTVTLAGSGVGSVSLTVADIEAAAPGAVSDTQIIIDSTLIAGLADGDVITVRADAQTVSWTLYTTPAISSATLDSPAAGDVTIDGTDFDSVSPNETSVRLVGTGVGDVTLTATQIVAVSPGAVSATQIIIDSTLVPSLALGDDIYVIADGLTSTAYTLS